MHDATVVERIRIKFQALAPVLDERTRRLWAAAEARDLGFGGVSAVARATGLARDTIRAGGRELDDRRSRLDDAPDRRVRRPGGGRKARTATDPEIVSALEALVEPHTRGDPQSPLRWTCKSTRQLAAELTRRGHPVGYRTVAGLLHAAGYSLQANRKTREGSQHPDRNAQFAFINGQAERFQRRRQPVISIDTKKKELVGDFRNGGREWRPHGDPEPVRVHDFVDPDLGKVIPYGVYDITHNQGWVSVGVDHDTAAFAAASIRRWWQAMGAARFPRAGRLLITADGGGSNSHRSRAWKVAVQGLADETGLTLVVCHFPPGTSKWNKVEHRLFCHITNNWRGQPLLSRQVIVQLIAATTTAMGLTVQAALDTTSYPLGIKVSDQQMAALRLVPAAFHGEWNYTVSPRKRS